MRGKHAVRKTQQHSCRITPAHAGKTTSQLFSRIAKPDHPRACGENVGGLTYDKRYSGSPPRMRGKPTQPPFATYARRITPAHAGKTLCHLLFYHRLTDHPRACGENSMKSISSSTADGSPPRMRGKLTELCYNIFSKRITPAHAGKTRY